MYMYVNIYIYIYIERERERERERETECRTPQLFPYPLSHPVSRPVPHPLAGRKNYVVRPSPLQWHAAMQSYACSMSFRFPPCAYIIACRQAPSNAVLDKDSSRCMWE